MLASNYKYEYQMAAINSNASVSIALFRLVEILQYSNRQLCWLVMHIFSLSGSVLSCY